MPTLRKPLHRTLAALALVFATLPAAHASYVVGTWDPTYGAPFTNLGWRGVATVQAANACLAVPGVVVNNGVACPLMTVVSAAVEFYNITDPLLTTLETLNFTNMVTVAQLSVAAGNLADGFALTSTGIVPSTLSLVTGVTGPTSFALDVDFVGGQSTAVLRWGTSLNGELLGRNDPQFPAHLRFATLPDPTGVPEPTPLALAGAALAALVLTRRRRA